MTDNNPPTNEPPFISIEPQDIDCPVCGRPINPILQMTGFLNDHGTWTLAHAPCIWTKPAFEREALDAPAA